MPRRKTPLINNQFYHIFNRTIDGKEIFTNKKIVKRALTTLFYYQYQNPPLRLSYFLEKSKEEQEKIWETLKQKNEKLIEIIAYCLMPNHYYLKIKQLVNNGISVFISKFQNSFTKFFNTLTNLSGHLFESQFKAKIILNEEELIHINRYIHLNPYTSFLIKNIEDLKNYFASSLPEYLDEKRGFCEKSLVLSHFKNLNDYWQFIRNQADYQRKLNQIKHLTFE